MCEHFHYAHSNNSFVRGLHQWTGCIHALPQLRALFYGCRMKITRDLFVELSKKSGVFSDKAMQFQERIMEKSGLGDETYLPPGDSQATTIRQQ